MVSGGNRRKIVLDEAVVKEMGRLYLEEKYSLRDLMDEFTLTYNVVKRILLEHNVQLRPAGHHKPEQ